MNSHLFLSVALATYNGEAYIGELLDSIAHQTRLPDEIVISDDASTDSTMKIVEGFVRLVPFPVRILINQERLGSTRNFEVAMRTCNGDIIFLCDQDDVWYPEKIACIEECFINNTEVGAVFTDANVVNRDLQPYGPKLWERVRFSLREQTYIATDPLTVLLKHYVVTGATMAFRSSFLDIILPIPEVWIHDAWIALMIGFSSNLVALPVPLIAYRQHGANLVGMPRPGKNHGKTLFSIYSPHVLLYELARDRFLEISDRIPDSEHKINNINEKIAFLSTRAALPDSQLRRLPILIRELSLLHYHRYAKKGVGTFFNDLIRGSWIL